MPDDIKKPSQPTTNAPPGHYKLKYLWIVSGLVLIIVALTAALIFTHTRHKSGQSANQPYRYSYHTLDNYKLDGSKAGSGATLQKPEEFIQQAQPISIHDQMIFVQSIDNNKQKIYAGSIAISSVPVDPAPTASYLQNLNQAILNPKAAGHQQLVAPLNQFVKDRLNPRFITIFAQPRALATPTIKTNAWLADFTASDSSTINSPSSSQNIETLPSHLKGQAVLAVGKSAYYYFMVTAVDYNWQSNSKIWPQVINSLKIDQ